MQVDTLHEEIIAPTTPANPRNGEGAIVSLGHGGLLLAWSRFIGGGRDHSPAEIWARTSSNGGRVWDEPYLLQGNVGGCNVMSVSLLRLASDALLFGYLVKHHESQDCHYYVRRSDDDGETWSAPVLATPEAGYFVVNNDRLIQTRRGRLLAPASKAVEPNYHCVAGCFYSDADGATWQRSKTVMDLPGNAGLQEPGIAELADGSLWMHLRTDRGCIYESRSEDGGEHWSAPEPTDLVAPLAPASAKCLPDSGDILMIYNDRRRAPHSVFSHRTPLAAAVSRDGGLSWDYHRLIEPDQSRSYCYTSIAFDRQATLLTYYVGKAGGPNLVDLKLKIVSTADWTMEEQKA